MNAKQFDANLRKAEKYLKASCPRLAKWIDRAGPCEWEPQWKREPMEALVRAIAHQQLHGKAAEAILGRLLALYPKQSFPSAEQILGLRKPKMRSFGFSAAKVEAIKGIARASKEGIIPTRKAAEKLSNEELIARLVPLKGIGPWTVEMWLIFSLGRLDVMPVDDYGVKSGLQHLFGLKALPKKKDFPQFSEVWKPYRSVAAWYLWRLADAKKIH